MSTCVSCITVLLLYYYNRWIITVDYYWNVWTHVCRSDYCQCSTLSTTLLLLYSLGYVCMICAPNACDLCPVKFLRIAMHFAAFDENA